MRIGERGVKSTEALLKAKEVVRNDVLQAKIEADSARVLMERARNRYLAAWRNLAAVLGACDMPPRPLAGNVQDGLGQLTWEEALCRLWAQSLDQRLGYLQDSKFYGIPDYLAEVQKRLPALSKAQVDAAIHRHLQSRNLVVAVVTEDAPAALDTLLAGKPTPIHYDSPGTPPEILEEDKLIERYPITLNRGRSRIVASGDLFER